MHSSRLRILNPTRFSRPLRIGHTSDAEVGTQVSHVIADTGPSDEDGQSRKYILKSHSQFMNRSDKSRGRLENPWNSDYPRRAVRRSFGLLHGWAISCDASRLELITDMHVKLIEWKKRAVANLASIIQGLHHESQRAYFVCHRPTIPWDTPPASAQTLPRAPRIAVQHCCKARNPHQPSAHRFPTS